MYHVVDLASKVIGYGASDRVLEQFLQSECGCGGGATQGKKQKYTYYDTTASEKNVRISEYLRGPSGVYGTLHRIRYYDLSIMNNVPYLLREAIVEPGTNGREWVTDYGWSANGELMWMATPSSVASYQSIDDTNGGPTSISMKSGQQDNGLVYSYEYTPDHRRSHWYVRNGLQGTKKLRKRLVYPSQRGPGERRYLPVRRDRYQAGVSSHSNADPNQVETGWFEYVFHGDQTDSDQIAVIRTMTEAERPSENGPSSGTMHNNTIVYEKSVLHDERGRRRWIHRADNTLIKLGYEDETGSVTKRTYNADPAGLVPADFKLTQSDVSGWGLEGGNRIPGGELVYENERDYLGRVTKRTYPGGEQRLVAREWRLMDLGGLNHRPGANYLVKTILPHKLPGGSFEGPARSYIYDAGGNLVASNRFELSSSAQYDRTNTDALLTTELGRSTVDHSLSMLVEARRRWHDISRDASYEWSYQYDELGRTSKITYPNGSVVEAASYDVLDRVKAVHLGTTGSGGTQPAAEFYYDDPNQDDVPEQGVGNGRVSWTVRHIGENATPNEPGVAVSDERKTFRVYDHRDRLIGVERPEAPHRAYAYDNLDRVIASGVFSSPATDPTSATDRGRYIIRRFSQRGRLYSSGAAIDPSVSSPDFLETHYWFDEYGRTLGRYAPNSPGQKVKYDAHGRPTTIWSTDRAGDPAPDPSGTNTDYAAATSVGDDHVIAQETRSYTDHNRVELIARRMRNHDADAAATGALTDSNSVVTYRYRIYDDARRLVRVINFGTNQNGFTSGGPEPSIPDGTVPDWNDAGYEDQLITAIGYNSRGLASSITDPKGRTTKRVFDDLSRRIAKIENHDDATVSWDGSLSRWSASGLQSSASDEDRVTSFVYDGVNNVTKRVAHLPDGSGGEDVQVTEYTYGVTKGSANNPLDSLVDFNHFRASAELPDGGTIQFAYNRLGELRGSRDQNGTEHAYERDLLGREVVDRVEAFGPNIDGRIDRIERGFDLLGRMSSTESFDGSTAVNGVEVTYTPLWQIENLFQDPDSAVTRSGGSPTGNTEVVAYDYVNSAVGAGNYSRKTSMDNPSATTLQYHYDGGFGIDDAISRISRIDLDDPFIQVIGADDLVAYDYLGAGGVAVTDYRNDVQLDRTVSHDGKRNAVGHTSQASGTYPAFDRFGRVVRHAWVDGQYGPGTDLTDGLPNRTPILEQTHTFDRASNRTSRVDARPGASIADRDFSFSYDELDRLTSSTRGAWDAQSGQMQTFAPGGQHWDLDVLGNWTERTADSDGDGQFTASDDGESRLHNVVNELTQRAIDADGFNRDLTYDDNGNLREEQIGSQSDRVYTHDAWNRLVEVGIDGGSGVTPIARYEYNGLDWRTVREHDTAGGSLQIDERRTLFYSASWRLLEEQVEPIPPEGSEPNEIMQHLWGLRYQDDLIANHRLGGQVEQGGMTIIEASETFYAITDLQFSVVGMMDAGLVRERVSYDAYGNATHRWMADVNGDGFANTSDEQAVSAAIGASIGDAGFAAEYDVDRSGTIDSTDLNYVSSQSTSIVLPGEISSDALGNTIGYSGYRFNQETQHYHVRNRCYSPELGRWLERDPMGYVDGTVLYEYVGSMPTSYGDPTGLSFWRMPKLLDGPLRWKVFGPRSPLFGEKSVRGLRNGYLNHGRGFRLGWSPISNKILKGRGAGHLVRSGAKGRLFFSLHGGRGAGRFHLYRTGLGLNSWSSVGRAARMAAGRLGAVGVTAAISYWVGKQIGKRTGIHQDIALALSREEFEAAQRAETCRFLLDNYQKDSLSCDKKDNIEASWDKRGCPGSLNSS